MRILSLVKASFLSYAEFSINHKSCIFPHYHMFTEILELPYLIKPVVHLGLASLAPDASEEGAGKSIMSLPRGSIFLIFGSFWLAIALTMSVYNCYTLLSYLRVIYHIMYVLLFELFPTDLGIKVTIGQRS